MDADTGQSSKQAGRELLESIFRDGTPAMSANAAHLASTHFGRIEGKRLQLGNVDRARPVPGLKTRAHHQIQRRDQRLIKKKRRHQTTSSSLIEGKGKEREQEQKPFSRRERQRLGLEKIDENLSYEMMAPIRHLWLDYIHRLVGLVDENGAVQCNQFRRSKVAGKDGPVEVTLNANNVAAFQTSLVKADFCGAPMRVIRALNPSLVGIEGIVARETESTFVIVTKSQHPQAKKSKKLVKIIPKHSSVFSLRIPLPLAAIQGASPHQQFEVRVPLYGNQLCNTMQSRATKKFKARKTIDL